MTEGFVRSVHFRQVLEYCHTNRQPLFSPKIICSSLTSMLPLYVVVEKVSLNKGPPPPKKIREYIRIGLTSRS